jgi:hypothetical protein
LFFVYTGTRNNKNKNYCDISHNDVASKSLFISKLTLFKLFFKDNVLIKKKLYLLTI